MLRLRSSYDSRVAIAGHAANNLEIALTVVDRIIGSNIDLDEKTARRSPIMFHGPRLIPCTRQLLGEPLRTLMIGE